MMGRHFHPAWGAKAMLAAPVMLAAGFAAVPLAPAHAERDVRIVEGLA